MSSPWKKQPEVVVDAVLKRAEVGKIGRKLKTRLALAQFKAARGWEDLTLDSIEPKVEEELKRRTPIWSGDILSDSSSSAASELRYSNSRNLMSSPLKGPAIFSDQVEPRSGRGSAYRKRGHHNTFELPSSGASSRKRFCSSPMAGRSVRGGRSSWREHTFTQSSPIKPRKQPHFTTSSGPSLSFYAGSTHLPEFHSNFAAGSDDEEHTLPAHSFMRSSPPRTPSPVRNRGGLGRRNVKNTGKEEGADLLLYLATSPSPANPTRPRMQPPSTPPSKVLALPSSMMTTPGSAGGGFFSSLNPNTPSQNFDFADFVNITPSPAQSAWPKTPRTIKTPLTVARRRLTFENPNASPNMREPDATNHAGLGMQLGGDLISPHLVCILTFNLTLPRLLLEMYLSVTLMAFWMVAAYVIYLFVSSFLRSRQQAVQARELQCEEPPFQKNRYPLGIDQIIRALAADRDKQFPVDTIKRMSDVGAITYRYSVLGNRNIFTADEKNIQAILASQFSDFDLGPTRRGNFWPLLGNGIFTQDGAGWEHSRAMMRPQFAREQVSDLEMTERHVQNMMKALDVDLGPNKWVDGVDLQVLFFRLTLDSATEFLFGESTDSQLRLLPGYEDGKDKSGGPLPADFASAFDKGQAALATRGRFGDQYYLCNPKGFQEACKTCHDFIDHFVRLALSKDLREKKLVAKGTKEKYVFLEALASETQDPIELRSQLLNILLAGRDTTASLLGWLFFSLAQDPARYAKLRDAIIEEFGTYDNPTEITFSRMKGCQYLQHCNNETLRLYPVVPINGRFANRDTTIPKGGGKDGQSKVFIPQGTTVDYSVHAMHHRKDLWGEDAEEFKPERFQGRRPGWDFLPFNGGPRICIGQQFALTESSYVTVRLIQRFDKLESLQKDPIARHNLTLTNCSGNGVKVRVHAI
ncbi:hypothetical protein QTJ16_001997 [Diplocarpon rosae]|uniref:Cytochrome P450 n=1 Tax=Diplocarpon rosae TaxID=946125 RepID=A0AAD9WH07_9HELO|nr:hypothetical protein QTJ16_001997 [Diplocarpon rosae]